MRRNGSLDYGPEIYSQTVLSLVVQPDGRYKVFANGLEVMSNNTTSNMTSLVPNVTGGWANSINIGRNQPDEWTAFNGNIGDVFLYGVALSDAERWQLEQDIYNKFSPRPSMGTSIGGKVTMEDGVTPVEGAKITCVGEITDTAITDANGNYLVWALRDSDVSISVSADCYQFVDPADGEHDIFVGADAIDNLNFKLSSINAISGIVKDIGGNPINNAVVQIGGVGGPGAVTDQNGHYRITNIPIGSVELYADALGYADDTQLIDTTPAASGSFYRDITLSAKPENLVIKNGGFEYVTDGVPVDWTLVWLRTETDWATVYTNPVPGNIDTLSVTADCASGNYAAKYATTSEWTFLTQEVPVVPNCTYNCYMKLKGDAGLPFIFPTFEFKNEHNESLAGYVSAEPGFNGWQFAPAAKWTQFLHWNTYENGLAYTPSIRLTPPVGATKLTVWIGFVDSPGGKGVYIDDVVIDRVGEVPPPPMVSSIRELKSLPENSWSMLVGSYTVTLAPTPGGVFYIGESDRIHGLRVVKSGTALNAGDTVRDLWGQVKRTLAGEVYFEQNDVPVGVPGAKMAPLGINNKAACEDPKILSNLVKLWGKVVEVAADQAWFTVRDGYSLPVKVVSNGLALPDGFDNTKTVVFSGVVTKDDAGSVVIFLGETPEVL